MPRGVAAINALWRERQEAAARAREEAEALAAQWAAADEIRQTPERGPEMLPNVAYGLLDPTLWGGQPAEPPSFAPQPWAPLPGAMRPQMPTMQSLPPLWPRWPDFVPTTSDVPAKIAAWSYDVPGDLPVLPVQYMDSVNYRGAAPNASSAS